MTHSTIIRLGQSDWQMYRSMRLAALQDAPDAFGSLFANENQKEDLYWQRRLAGADPSTDFPALALVNEQAAGLVWAVIGPPPNPIGHVFQMWVTPEHRGCGLGRLMLEHLLNWFRSKNVTVISLGVTCGNSPARALYESCGFSPVGTPEPLREQSDLLAQDMRAVLC